jgi:HSP20 family molecular chaperone IbpA
MVTNPPDRPIFAAPLEIREREDGFVVTMDIPGATRRSTDVTMLDERTFSVRARRMDSLGDDVGDWGAIVTLPHPVDRDGVQASVAEGVLKIDLPRLDGGRRRIEVRAYE